ncbi:hypothetical protein NPIL_87211 [Nephila pilipes]|uniref:Uncharacterized protein n=1 Tax=Nephila pilipes TaxID=299642 RepID=A0A8X6U424_NEPPI|nr:hypothetical protein NPIL_87211 [Nephila pilipes]
MQRYLSVHFTFQNSSHHFRQQQLSLLRDSQLKCIYSMNETLQPEDDESQTIPFLVCEIKNQYAIRLHKSAVDQFSDKNYPGYHSVESIQGLPSSCHEINLRSVTTPFSYRDRNDSEEFWKVLTQEVYPDYCIKDARQARLFYVL